MMNRKKLTNKEKFVFNDAEIVAPLGNGVHSKRPSVQNRLFPKAETNKPTFNPPIPGTESPFTPGCTINKECPTTDPCVEEVVAKLAKFNIEPQSSIFPQAAPKSCSKEVFDPFESYHKNMYFSSQNTNKIKEEKFVNGNTTEKKALPLRKPGAVSRPISPLTPPYSPDDEALKQKGSLERKEDNVDSCICMRPLKLILCPVCSHTTTGRIRKMCQAHPKALFLLDIEACPMCKETKFVLKEYELPDGSIPVVNNLVS